MGARGKRLSTGENPMDGLQMAEMTLVEHLAELRLRLIVVLISFVLGAIVGWLGVPYVLDMFEQQVGRLVFFTPAEAFVTRLKIAAFLGLLITGPIAVAQAWLFVMPALFPHERRMLRAYVPISLGLFALGLLFGFYVIYPVALGFVLGVIGSDVQAAISVAELLTFFVGTTVPLGLAFQLPMVLLVVARLRLVNPLVLRRGRRHVIFWTFVLSAVVTPPDVVSQILLALPVLALFELGLCLARRAVKK